MSSSLTSSSESTKQLFFVEDADDLSIATSWRTISSESLIPSSGSSLTQWGPGTLSGKAIMAVGEAMLDAVENIIIRRRLRTIAKHFPHTDSMPVPGKIYDDLVELSRLVIDVHRIQAYRHHTLFSGFHCIAVLPGQHHFGSSSCRLHHRRLSN
jgi:hypothetical protein